jgi:hypothetical protein
MKQHVEGCGALIYGDKFVCDCPVDVMSDPLDIPALHEIAAAATPGPWHWSGNTKSRVLALCTWISGQGRTNVMDFTRWGMHGARPRFNVDNFMQDADTMVEWEVCKDATRADDPRLYRHDVTAIKHPDATFIATFDPVLVERLLTRITELEGKCVCGPWHPDGPLEEDCPVHGRPYAEWVELTVAARSALSEAQTEAERWRKHYEDTYKAYSNAKKFRHSSCIALEQRRTSERDAALAEVERLREECAVKGCPQHSVLDRECVACCRHAYHSARQMMQTVCNQREGLRAERDAALADVKRLEQQGTKLADGLHIWREQCERAEAEVRRVTGHVKNLIASYADIPGAEIFMPSEVRQLVSELETIVEAIPVTGKETEE